MQQSIWKQKLVATDLQTIALPKGAKILCVQEQHGDACIWFTNPNLHSTETEERTFRIIGTGHVHESIPEKYIGTFQLQEGKLIFHLFEK